MRTPDGNTATRTLLIVTFCLLLVFGAMGSAAYVGGGLYPAPSFGEANAGDHAAAHESLR